jgi:hypothetical protein
MMGFSTWMAAPGLIALRVNEPIQVRVGIDHHELLYDRPRHFGASPSATRPGKQEKRPVAQPNQPIGAGGKHCFQRFFGERLLWGGHLAALGVGAPNAPQQFLNVNVAHGI